MQYEQFLYYNLLQEHGKIPSGIEYDILFERIPDYYLAYTNSKYDDPNKPLVECMLEFINSDEFSLEPTITLRLPSTILSNAQAFLDAQTERDELNIDGDHDAAFEVECTQRDIGCYLAEQLIGANK